jgi:hypothetical protein
MMMMMMMSKPYACIILMLSDSDGVYLFVSWRKPHVYDDERSFEEHSDGARAEERQVLPPVTDDGEAVPAPGEGAEKGEDVWHARELPNAGLLHHSLKRQPAKLIVCLFVCFYMNAGELMLDQEMHMHAWSSDYLHWNRVEEHTDYRSCEKLKENHQQQGSYVRRFRQKIDQVPYL